MKLQDRLEEIKSDAYVAVSEGMLTGEELEAEFNEALASIEKDMKAIINEPSDTVKKGDTAFTALDKFRIELRKALEEYIG